MIRRVVGMRKRRRWFVCVGVIRFEGMGRVGLLRESSVMEEGRRWLERVKMRVER